VQQAHRAARDAHRDEDDRLVIRTSTQVPSMPVASWRPFGLPSRIQDPPLAAAGSKQEILIEDGLPTYHRHWPAGDLRVHP
jgi:hypothetical protein